jgi:hypothetical protein
MNCACNAPIHPRRAALGYTTCLTCGEQQARQRKHTVIPLHKQGYMAFSGDDALDAVKQINPRRTT